MILWICGLGNISSIIRYLLLLFHYTKKSRTMRSQSCISPITYIKLNEGCFRAKIHRWRGHNFFMLVKLFLLKLETQVQSGSRLPLHLFLHIHVIVSHIAHLTRVMLLRIKPSDHRTEDNACIVRYGSRRPAGNRANRAWSTLVSILDLNRWYMALFAPL